MISIKTITRAYHTREAGDIVFCFPLQNAKKKAEKNSPIQHKCQIT